MALVDDLKKIVQGEVENSQEALAQASRDASLFHVEPKVVVKPQSAADIEALVRYAAQEKKKNPKSDISITARSAGTDMSGGPLNDSIIIEMTPHLNRLLELSAGEAVVEPGMYFRDFDKETQKKQLELPSYTASREINTVGGMAANNSGGEKNLKYGKTARWVEKLDVVLADGAVHHLKNLEGNELRAKLAEESFEGDLYRRVSQLINAPEHRKTIEEHKPTVEKNSSGYALWDIGDGRQRLNLARLMVGAQGTLGIITKIWFKLVKPEPYASMVVLFLDNLAELGEVVPDVLAHHPDSFESYDDNTFKLAVKYFPEFAAQMKGNLFSLAWQFLPEVFMMLTGGVPKLVLLCEFRGTTQEEALKKAEALAEQLRSVRPPLGVRIAKTEAAARKYWVVRRESFNLLRKKVRGKRTAPFIDDFVVPPNKLTQFLPELNKILDRYKDSMLYTVAGHVGDGNFHIIPLVNPNDPKLGRMIDALSHEVYDLVLHYHGSITGEHNDGLVRTPYVEKMFGPAMYALFFEVKKIFDPLNIFNPGKKVGGTWADALAKLDLPSVKSQTKA